MTTVLPSGDAPLLPLDAPLARTPGAPSLQRQLLRRVRDAILGGAMPAGTRLPGTRALAETLGVSRNTTAAVYEQLVAEGFLQSDRRGTRVVGCHGRRRRAGVPPAGRRAALGRIRPSRIGTGESEGFRPGVPALTHFPADAWRHAIDRALRRAGRDLLGYGDPLGGRAARIDRAPPAVTRGVRCDPEQIVITEGAQGAIALCAQLLTNPGDTVWVEAGYRGARTAMQAADLDVVPMPVDAEGLRTDEDDWRERTPRLVYDAVEPVPDRRRAVDLAPARADRCRAPASRVDHRGRLRQRIPSHRRADRRDARPRPIRPSSISARSARRCFRRCGSVFSCCPTLLAAVRPVLPEMLRGGTRHVQLALADFIETGEYGRHLGRMRRLYRDRRRLLLAALDGNLSVPHQIEGGPCGLHLALRLPARYRDRAIVDAARAHGIGPFPLSGFSIDAGSAGNAVLGFGNTSADAFEPMLRMLSAIAERWVGSHLRVAGRGMTSPVAGDFRDRIDFAFDLAFVSASRQENQVMKMRTGSVMTVVAPATFAT